MTAYDVTDLLTSRTGFGAVAGHLQNMRVRHTSFFDNSVKNTTSTGLSTARSNNITGIVESDLVVVHKTFMYSGDTAGMRTRFFAGIGTDYSDDVYCTNAIALTNGLEHSISMVHFATGQSGTLAVVSRWAIQDKNGGTAVYSGAETTNVFVVKDGGAL